MTKTDGFRWFRIILAVIGTEVIPILALLAIVMIYSVVGNTESATPEEFAPLAGNWVGPIGGFFATLMFAAWTARGAVHRPLAYGLAVGIGTAALDFAIGSLLSGDESIEPLLVISNVGRVLAGALGGLLIYRRR